MKRVTVIGLGTIGAGWATLLAAHGYEVNLFDSSPGCVERARELVESRLAFLFDHGLTPCSDLAAARANVKSCDRLDEALRGACLVQESIVEDYREKAALYDQIECLLPAHVTIASSSSGLLISRLQEDRLHAERFLIGHPWNPPYLIPLVEIVPGPLTHPRAVDDARRIYESLGLDPITLKKEVPGHLGNRLAAALWREAIDLVLQGVASVEDVDRAIRSGPGSRWALMGAHLTYYLGGGAGGIEHFTRHLQPAFESWWADLASWSRLPNRAEAELSAGIGNMLGAASFEDMVQRRDELLASFLKLNPQRRQTNPLSQGVESQGVEIVQTSGSWPETAGSGSSKEQ